MSAPTPESRLRISPDLRGLGGVAVSGVREHLPPSQPRLLKGRMIEQARTQAQIANLARLEANKRNGSWSALLAGDTDQSKGGVHLNSKRCIGAAGVAQDKSVLSFGGAIAGPDYAQLQADNPAGRYKFYHSFQNQARGEAYLTELIRRASEQGLSMSMKAFDHSYDGMNVYTHHYQEMLALIQETYPKYGDAFLSTEHFLQGDVPGVNPDHIGWAQEPGAEKIAESHSARMGIVGRALDQGGLSEASFRQGCEAAGVRPDAPWLLNDATLQSIAA